MRRRCMTRCTWRGQRLAEENGAGARKVIVLITDGENTTRHGSYDAALEEALRAGAMVYSLIIVPVAADAGRNVGGEHALIQMARDTGGKFYYVEDKHDLAPAFAHVSDDLRNAIYRGVLCADAGEGALRAAADSVATEGSGAAREVFIAVSDGVLRGAGGRGGSGFEFRGLGPFPVGFECPG